MCNNTGCGHILWVSYCCNIGTFFVYIAEVLQLLLPLASSGGPGRYHEVKFMLLSRTSTTRVAMTTLWLYYHCGTCTFCSVLYICMNLGQPF